MNRQRKEALLEKMQPILSTSHIYILDCDGLNAKDTHQLRGMLHAQDIACRVVPNSMLKILFQDTDRKTLLPLLKKSSMLLLTQESPSTPAKVLKEFYKATGQKNPTLKGAFAYDETFLGAEQLKALSQIKSKEELIGEVLTLLQSPSQQLLSALQSGQSGITGVLKTLADR